MRIEGHTFLTMDLAEQRALRCEAPHVVVGNHEFAAFGAETSVGISVLPPTLTLEMILYVHGADWKWIEPPLHARWLCFPTSLH